MLILFFHHILYNTAVYENPTWIMQTRRLSKTASMSGNKYSAIPELMIAWSWWKKAFTQKEDGEFLLNRHGGYLQRNLYLQFFLREEVPNHNQY